MGDVYWWGSKIPGWWKDRVKTLDTIKELNETTNTNYPIADIVTSTNKCKGGDLCPGPNPTKNGCTWGGYHCHGYVLCNCYAIHRFHGRNPINDKADSDHENMDVIDINPITNGVDDRAPQGFSECEDEPVLRIDSEEENTDNISMESFSLLDEERSQTVMSTGLTQDIQVLSIDKDQKSDNESKTKTNLTQDMNKLSMNLYYNQDQHNTKHSGLTQEMVGLTINTQALQGGTDLPGPAKTSEKSCGITHPPSFRGLRLKSVKSMLEIFED